MCTRLLSPCITPLLHFRYTNWELAARVPFVLAVPGKPQSHGAVTSAVTENVDVYPTLASAAGLPVPEIGCDGCIEGDDATPLLDDPFRPWKAAGFSQYVVCVNGCERVNE